MFEDVQQLKRKRSPSSPREIRNERIFTFVRLERVACDPYADAGHRRGRSAVALAEDLCVRPVSARATLHARARTEMAREARAQRWVVARAALAARQNAALFARRAISLDLERLRWLGHRWVAGHFAVFGPRLTVSRSRTATGSGLTFD